MLELLHDDHVGNRIRGLVRILPMLTSLIELGSLDASLIIEPLARHELLQVAQRIS